MMRKKKVRERGVAQRLYSNVGLNFGAQLLLLLMNLVTAPYIVHHLGPVLFGVLALVQAVAGFAGVLNIGVGRSLTKFISEHNWKSDINQINELFQTGWSICLVCGLAAMCLLVGPAKPLMERFFRDGTEISEGLTTFAVYVAALGLLFTTLLEAISAVPVAAQRFGIRNIIQIMMGVTWSLGSVIFLARGYSIRAVLLANLLSSLLGLAAYLVTSRSIIPGLEILPRVSWPAFKALMTFSFPLMLSAVTALVVSRIDRFILAYYLPLAAVTYYTLPYSLSEKLTLAVSNVLSVVYPLTSELHAMNSHERMRDLYIQSNKGLMLIVTPIAVILVAIPGPILQYWLGVEFALHGATALALLAAAVFLNSVTAIPTVTSLAVGRAWMPSGFSFITSAANLALNLLLVPVYGIDGAASALLISVAVGLPVFVHRVNRAIGVPSRGFFFHVLLRPLGIAGVQFALLVVVRKYMGSLVDVLIWSCTSLLLFGFGALFLAMSRQERSIFIELVLPTVSGRSTRTGRGP